MKEHWSYCKENYKDKKGQRWHFVTCSYLDDEIEYPEQPIEIFFRSDDRSYYGSIRFEHKKDNPYMFSKLTEKVMNNEDFREQHSSPGSQSIWRKNWK